MSRTDAWDILLDDDEKIIWQDRPDKALALTVSDWFAISLLIVFPAYLLWNYYTGIPLKQPGAWALVLSYFPVVIFWTVLRRPLLRRFSHYALTNKRALIQTHLPIFGQRVRAYPIEDWTPLDLREGPLSDVHFTTRKIYVNKRGFKDVPAGFERIPHGSEVYQIMQELKDLYREEKMLP